MAKVYEKCEPKTVAFIGLGTMGYPMAGHLARAGHRVTVYNRTTAKAQQWAKEYTGLVAPTPREAVQDADFVFTCVGNDDDVRSVVLGRDGAFAGMKEGATLIDCTTDSANLARELGAQAAQRGLHFMDAPVSGGQAGAVNGVLTVMCGADEAVFDATKPTVMAFAQAVTRIGDVGCGQLAKMCNQICIAGVVQSLSESIAFGLNAGLDMKLVLDVIGKGAAQSWQMDNRGKTMIEGAFNFGFAIDWMRKDLGLCLAEANRNGSTLPTIALIDQFYADLQARGEGRSDTSVLIKRLPH